MVKYKVNLIFKEDGKSLNETITEVLKIELNRKINNTCSILNKGGTCDSTHYSQEGSSN